MCGIAGFWSLCQQRADPARAMADRLRHRGPDNGDTWNDAAAGVSLGHRRLAIVDLSAAGRQPMTSPSGRYVIVLNGEIYNHLDLRRDLDAAGATGWRGHSDTETLLAAIDRWGLDAALSRAVGMFALATWDRRERTLSLARDRLGEKPLYYGWTCDGVAFASELKALRAAPGFAPVVDPAVLALYLRHNCVPAPWSIFRGIYKLEPGAILTIAGAAMTTTPDAPLRLPHDGGGLAYRRFWSLDDTVAQPVEELADDTAVDRVETVLAEAVRAQTLAADVPVGAFLSGGVDSSLIVALMTRATAKVATFTIGFDHPGFDEAPYARAVARHLGTDHHELYVSADDVRGVIPDLPAIYDEPFADSSQLPTFLVSRLARRSVTVALSGDGGDELFGGYNRYRLPGVVRGRLSAVPPPLRRLAGAGLDALPPEAWNRIGGLPGIGVSMLGTKMAKLARLLGGDLSARAIYDASSQEWLDAAPVRYPAPTGWQRPDPAALTGSSEARMMYWDTRGYLADDILVKVDRAAMANGLETRAPFLDHRVVELAWRLPMRLKLRGGAGKWVLRQVLDRHVPRALIERPKAGFAVPVGAWLRGPLRAWGEELLSPQALAEQPAFDPTVIRRRWSEHLSGGHDWTGSLWSVLMYQAWAQHAW